MEQIAEIYEEIEDNTHINKESKVPIQMHKRIKILCLVLTIKSHLNWPIQVVNNTWGRRCNKILYVLCSNQKTKDILNSCNIQESKKHLVAKVRYMFHHAYKNFLFEYEWFLKADDDTYVIMDNLRFLLSHHDHNKPAVLGYHFKKHVKQGYMSGGAGYVISRKGLQMLVEKGFQGNGCQTDGKDEDVEIGKCLENASVVPLSSYDRFGRQTFHTDTYFEHFTGSFPVYLNSYSWNLVSKSVGCCSQFSVSFHHVSPIRMLFLHHFLYQTSISGVEVPIDNIDIFISPNISSTH